MFSPYYARAVRRGDAVAENYAAMNVALYRPNRWAMTERSAKNVRRAATRLEIGRSFMAWDGAALTAGIDEVTVPVPRRLRGGIRLTPARIEERVYHLDAAGRHRWRPIAPQARIEVAFERPGISWSGHAYFDSNNGDVPLAEDFRSWHWSRANSAAGVTVLYDVQRRDGSAHGLALNFSEAGGGDFTPPPAAELPRSFWGVARETRVDAGSTPRVLQTFEDAPFYARTKIAARMNGEEVTAVHESLDLDRFAAPWVRLLLRFRMPRI